MPGVMLDIGAGSTEFVCLFRRFNPEYKLMYLCGEPDWNNHWSEKVRVKKVLKIKASYDQFNVSDASLHFVTLNAFHPLMRPQGIEAELARTLCPSKGVFISAHPAGCHPEPSDEFFYPIHFRDTVGDATVRITNVFSGRRGIWRRPVCSMAIDRYPVLHYPASPTICSRLRELRLPEEFRNRSSSYCYARSEKSPTIKVWLRNKKPVP